MSDVVRWLKLGDIWPDVEERLDTRLGMHVAWYLRHMILMTTSQETRPTYRKHIPITSPNSPIRLSFSISLENTTATNPKSIPPFDLTLHARLWKSPCAPNPKISHSLISHPLITRNSNPMSNFPSYLPLFPVPPISHIHPKYPIMLCNPPKRVLHIWNMSRFATQQTLK